MKENQNIIQTISKTSGGIMKENSDRFYPSVEGNMPYNYVNNHMNVTSPVPAGTPLPPGVRSEQMQLTPAPTVHVSITSPPPSYLEKENINSNRESPNVSDADTTRSPMSTSVSDSSLELSSPEGSQAPEVPHPRPTETSTPLQPPQQPVRRRPGRPPGSTKKFKQPFEYRKKDPNAPSGDDFSLRKFFEAGGRDYNEYLEWLKKRQAQQNAQTA